MSHPTGINPHCKQFIFKNEKKKKIWWRFLQWLADILTSECPIFCFLRIWMSWFSCRLKSIVGEGLDSFHSVFYIWTKPCRHFKIFPAYNQQKKPSATVQFQLKTFTRDEISGLKIYLFSLTTSGGFFTWYFPLKIMDIFQLKSSQL